MLNALDALGRAGCPQPAVDRIENRNSQVVRSSLGERTAEDSRPYLETDGRVADAPLPVTGGSGWREW